MRALLELPNVKPRPPRVLVVDDDEDEFMLFEAFARRAEVALSCEWASTAAEAIARLEQGDVDVMFVDNRMFDGTGLELIARLSELKIDCPTVFMSQHLNQELEAEASRLGVFAVLCKEQLSAATITKTIGAAIAEAEREEQPGEDGSAPPGGALAEALANAKIGRLVLNGGSIASCDATAADLLRLEPRLLVDRNLFDLLERTPAQPGGRGEWVWYHLRGRADELVLQVCAPSNRELREAGEQVTLIQDASDAHAKQQLLESTWRDMEAFSYGASHDLQAPLRKIVMFSEALRESTEPGHQSADFAMRAARSAREMSGLVTALLEYSRSGNRSRRLRIAPQCIATAVDEAVRTCEVDRRGPMSLSVEVSGYVLADLAGLRHVLVAVLSNAIRFCKAGQAPKITVRSEVLGSKVSILVRDDGVGIDAAHVEQIFAPFERLFGRSEYPGHGLGLATARRWMQRMSGEVTLSDSAPHKGSTFCIRLPAAAGGAG